MDADRFDLQRFVEAQRDLHGAVLDELRAGHKRSHWMWFVFPQLTELGRSETARRYGIGGLAEARAYASHPTLGPRLVECARLVLAQHGRHDAHAIFGSPDDLKLCSCMTLFERANAAEPIFAGVLDAFYDGHRDARTLALLG